MRETPADSGEIKVMNDNIVLDSRHQELVHVDSRSTYEPYDERVRFLPEDATHRGIYAVDQGLVSRANYNYQPRDYNTVQHSRAQGVADIQNSRNDPEGSHGLLNQYGSLEPATSRQSASFLPMPEDVNRP